MPYMEWAKTVMEGDLRDVIDAGSSGIAPVTLRELGVRIADLALDGPHGYSAARALPRAIARDAGTDEAHVMPALGASHALSLVCASLLEPGDEVLVETPGYEALSLVPRVFGARVVPLPRRFEDGFQIDPDELRRLVTRRTRLVLVTNLHNPSGVALSRDGLDVLAALSGGRVPPARVRRGAVRSAAAGGPAGARATEPRPREASTPGSAARSGGAPGARDHARLRERPWVVVNEVYRDFLRDDPPPAGHTLGPRGVSLCSLTKVYGLGYTRVGWIVGDPALIHRASRVNDFGVVNDPYIADSIGVLALRRRARLLERTFGIVHANSRVLARFLETASRLEHVPPAGGLVLFPRVRGARSTRAFVDRAIREHGVCVVPGEFFGAPGHVRIGIGTRRASVLAEGLRRLGRALDTITNV
jgi:aspartate/methionine/tyrosine aminotransferase